MKLTKTIWAATLLSFCSVLSSDSQEFGILTSQPSAGLYAFDFDGRFVVWRDTRSGWGTGRDIYAYDLLTSAEIPVATDPPGDRFQSRVSGGVVAWIYLPRPGFYGGHQVWVKDLTGKIGSAGDSRMVDQAYGFEGLDIKGDWLAWARVGAPGNPDELFAENLRTGDRISIPRPNLDWNTVWQIVVSGNTVFFATTPGYVWGGDWDVYGFDLVSRGNPFPVKVGPGNFGPVSADGDYVLLQEMPNSSYSPPRNLYLHNLVSGQDTLLASGSYPIGSVSGNRVVYTDNSGQVTAYDISSGERSLVSAGPALGYPPIVVEGDTVVWTDQRPPAYFGGFFIYGYKFADTTPPTITCPADITVPCSVDLLVPVTFSATAHDDCTPQPTVICNPPSGSGFPVGVTTVTCTATDEAGNTSTCTFKVTRAPLGFTGFLPPPGGADETGGSFIAPLRTLKLGSTVPVKFTASCGGTPITTGVHRLQLIKFSDATNSEEPIDASPQDAATSGNQFRLTDGQWHFNLDTKATGMTKGIWQLVATLSDGSQHRAWIQVK